MKKTSVENFLLKICSINKKALPLQPLSRQRRQSGCSAVGSALRSGRRGRAFESPHPDKRMKRNVFTQRLSALFLLHPNHLFHPLDCPCRANKIKPPFIIHFPSLHLRFTYTLPILKSKPRSKVIAA